MGTVKLSFVRRFAEFANEDELELRGPMNRWLPEGKVLKENG